MGTTVHLDWGTSVLSLWNILLWEYIEPKRLYSNFVSDTPTINEEPPVEHQSQNNPESLSYETPTAENEMLHTEGLYNHCHNLTYYVTFFHWVKIVSKR